MLEREEGSCWQRRMYENIQRCLRLLSAEDWRRRWSIHTAPRHHTSPGSIQMKFKERQHENTISQTPAMSGGCVDWVDVRGNFSGCRHGLYLDWGGAHISSYKCKWLSSCAYNICACYGLYCVYVMLWWKKKSKDTDTEAKLMLTKGERVARIKIRSVGLKYMHHYMWNRGQQGPTVQHRELCSISCNKPE